MEPSFFLLKMELPNFGKKVGSYATGKVFTVVIKFKNSSGMQSGERRVDNRSVLYRRGFIKYCLISIEWRRGSVQGHTESRESQVERFFVA